MLEPLIIQPKNGFVDSCVVFLHGLGDTGHGWKSEMDSLSLSFPKTRFVLPHAPLQNDVISGRQIPSWYNIYNFPNHNEKDFSQATEYLKKLIEQQVLEGIPYDKIIIGGFSQGAVVSLLLGLAIFDKKPLGGIISLSGYLPLEDKIQKILKERNGNIPRTFIAHGTDDDTIQYSYATKANHFLKKNNCRPVFRTYKGMPHSVSKEEMKHIKQFLNEILNEKNFL